MRCWICGIVSASSHGSTPVALGTGAAGAGRAGPPTSETIATKAIRTDEKRRIAASSEGVPDVHLRSGSGRRQQLRRPPSTGRLLEAVAQRQQVAVGEAGAGE